MTRFLFRLAIRLYPAPLRRRFAPSLEATFEDALRAARKRGALRALYVALAESVDVARAGLRYRLGGTDNHRTPTRPMSHLLQDIRFAIRSFRRTPGFVFGAVSVLSVAIGLNVAMFSIVEAYLLEPLPFPAAERIYSVRPGEFNSMSVARAFWGSDWYRQPDGIEHAVTWDLDGFTILGDDRPEYVRGAWVTPEYFTVTGVSARLGRTLTRADTDPSAPGVALIGYRLWQDRFGGKPDIIGETITAYAGDRPFESEVFEVVGVLPEDFWFINNFTEFLAPLEGPRQAYMLQLSPTTSAAQVEDQLTAMARGAVPDLPDGWKISLTPTHDLVVENVRPALVALSTAVLLVLLVASANVAIHLMLRTAGRTREIALRRAVGAGRARLLGQFVTEGMVLATLAGAAGTALALGGLALAGEAIQSQLGTGAPGAGGIATLRVEILGMSLAASLLTGIAFTAVPALTAIGTDIRTALASSTHSATGGRRSQATRSLLIGLEIALSLSLLVGAGLMTRTLRSLGDVRIGFEPEGAIAANITLRQRSYEEPQDLVAFADRLQSRLAADPGVVESGLLAGWPISDQMGVNVSRSAGTGSLEVSRYVVTAGFFDVMKIPLEAGRHLSRADRSGTEPVAVVSRSVARELWPERSPIGQPIVISNDDSSRTATVVGVVGDIRETLTGEPVPDIYVPYVQAPRTFLFALIRTNGPPETILEPLARAVADIDPTAALGRHALLSDLVDREAARPRFLAGMLTVFSGIAILLAVVGLYSLMAFAVAQSRREVAVRMALGAPGRRVVWLFMRRGLLVVAAGLGLGVLGSLYLGRILESQLFGVPRIDPATVGAAALLMATSAVTALWVATRQAALTDAAEVLREN